MKAKAQEWKGVKSSGSKARSEGPRRKAKAHDILKAAKISVAARERQWLMSR